MSKRTFFDQWYRVANLRIGVRHSVTFRQTRYLDEVFYVYHEPIYNGFYRARPETHKLIGRISPNLTLSEIWHDCVENGADTAPGQEEFFDLIASLYRANMIYVEGAVSETRLLERSIQKKAKPVMAQVSELFFLKIPLWDPDPFLTRHQRVIDAIFSKISLVCVAVLMLVALNVFFVNHDRAFHQAGSILQPHNLFSLFLATFVTHIFHEMAHAALCKRFGGDVRSMGVMLLMFAPLPFADVSSSWLMRNANHRAAIGAVGMFSDMIFCAIATIFWAYSPAGWQNEIAFNVMFTTAIYTFVFNLNPLMRFDGYYILSDIIKIPNLHQKAKSQFSAWWRSHILKEPIPAGEVTSERKKIFLIVFFIASFIYKNIVSFGIVLFLADQYLGLGLIGAVAVAYNSFIKPMSGGFKEFASPYFRARHKTVLRRTGFIFMALILALFLVPLPDYRRFQGIVEVVDRMTISAGTDGEIQSLPVSRGDHVGQGVVLLTLRNENLAQETDVLNAKLRGAELRLRQSTAKGGQEIASIQREVASLSAQLYDNAQRRAALTVYAPRAGIWLGPQGAELGVGKWVQRGQKLGEVLDQSVLRFRGVLPQVAAYGLGEVSADRASVRIVGDLGTVRRAAILNIVPFSSKDLPSSSLSPMGGGNLAVDQKSPEQVQAVERFFLVDAQLATNAALDVAEGRSAWMQLRLPARPLAFQWKDRLVQFVQQRYKL